MASKRLRMFAGPNGSGKSTIFNKIRSQFSLGIYLNADEIEYLLRNRNQLSLKAFNLSESHGLKFNKFLQKHRSIMLIKMHYYESDKITFHSVNEPSHIFILNSKEINDINRILNHIDVLITDYSSVFYDFLVLDRPILFAPFDLEEYQKIDRELYEDYDKTVMGINCNNWSQEDIEDVVGQQPA